tara:strand:- start:646 stop:849 length:204 start_codon:yes stop_codon:yes gene_type:complete
VGKFKHELGKTYEIMDFFKGNEDTFKASEEEVVRVVMWESKEHFEPYPKCIVRASRTNQRPTRSLLR